MPGSDRNHFLVPEAGKPLEFSPPEEFVIGRNSEAHLAVRLTDVSRHHAVIQWGALEPLPILSPEGAGGTFVNGQRVSEPTRITHGDELRFGATYRITYLFATHDDLRRIMLEREQGRTSEHRTIREISGEVAQLNEGWDSLTPRERDVVRLAIQGFGNREIAEELTISVSTVKLHLSNSYTKTGAQGRTELAALLLGGKRPPWMKKD